MRKTSLDSVSISLSESQILLFHSAESVHSQSSPLEAVGAEMLLVASIMLPLLSLGLPSGACHWSSLKVRRMSGLTTMKRGSKWRVEKGSN